jgi:hypothetical protein
MTSSARSGGAVAGDAGSPVALFDGKDWFTLLAYQPITGCTTALQSHRAVKAGRNI